MKKKEGGECGSIERVGKENPSTIHRGNHNKILQALIRKSAKKKINLGTDSGGEMWDTGDKKIPTRGDGRAKGHLGTKTPTTNFK